MARLGTRAARTAAVLATALTLSLPLVALPSAAAAAPQSAAVAGESVLPAAPRAVPRATQILTAGTSGFLWVQEGDDRLLWTDYATGATTALEQRLDVPVQYDIDSGYFVSAASFKTGYYGAGSDTVALYSEEAAQVTLLKGGGTAVVPVPEYHTYQGTFGDAVLTSHNGTGAYRLWRVQDGGEVTGTSVTGLPDGAGGIQVEDGDARSVIVKYSTGASDEGWGRWGIVDLATGAFSALPDRDGTADGYDTTGFRLGADSVLRLRTGRGKADLYDRDDLSAAPRTFETGSLTYQASYGIVGDRLLGVEPVSPGDNKYRGQPLFALTSDGTDTDLAKVMDPAAHGIVQAPDGSVLVAGAEQYVEQGDLDWGVYRVARAADGSVTRSRLTSVQPMPATVRGLALGSGILTTADNSTLYEPNTILGAYRSSWLTTSGTPGVAKASVDGLVSGWDGDCTGSDTGCIRMFADGTGHHGRQDATESDLTMLRTNGTTTWGPTLDTGDDSPYLKDLSGRYAVVDGAASGYQYIGEFADGAAGKVLQKRDRVAAAVWGNTLWSAAATGGKVTATRLPSGTAVESFTTRNGCTPSSVQAVGRWVYWVCVDAWGDVQGSGVYDRTAKRTATAPASRVLLGDGYLVERVGGIQSVSGLNLIDLHNGLPSSGDHTDLPSRKLAAWTDIGQDNLRVGLNWTVDRFGGGVAYADREQRVHLVPTGVPASALTAIDSTVTPKSASWSGTWWLSKPAAAWQVTVRNKASGTTVRTLTGSAARGLLTAAWDGKDSAGRLVTNGTYTWTLTAQPADGQGAALTLSGTVKVTAGAAAPRDHAGRDGVGDVLTLNSSGALTVHRGTGTGTLGSKVSGAGWPSTARFVPFGDLSGDRCNDVLVRPSSGALRAYRPACGTAPTPSTPYTTLAGSGWNQYDALTSPGDLSGDGRPDLIARNASTGTVYLYKGTSADKLSARVKLYDNWKTYKKLVGAGDLNGDGIGDLLAQEKSNNLYRYDGTGRGTFKARVKVFSNWGASYNAVVGVGDITGDGRTDLVSRDTSGNLYRNSGNGKGSFGGRTKIATGWQGYKAVV
ncbi:FG-GAP-like repeat-containing protein [Streptomyces sp. GESEQ-35]|uniref:FG-GAP-like repeat-containing protein n=1 Tax=Streptomyces sp. GESEQ-35 TaxID=2812657 RepID=UPI001B329E7B|nr:FG-GAP-like repeat-containing protein [Streptomyces sp. GESEQ-35]